MLKIKVGIIGAGGYGGCGAIELLLGHPNAEIVALLDKQDVGKPISDIYPHLKGFCDLPLIDPDDPVDVRLLQELDVRALRGDKFIGSF